MKSVQVASKVSFNETIHKIWGPNGVACMQGNVGKNHQETMPEAGRGYKDTNRWPCWGAPQPHHKSWWMGGQGQSYPRAPRLQVPREQI